MVESGEFGVSGVWGSSPTDVWAVGSAILHYNGVGWRVVLEKNLPRGEAFTNFLKQPRPADSFLDYDGSADQAAGRMPRFGMLEKIWGASASDIFAVGRLGLVMHYDGVKWSAMRAGYEADFRAVWGAAGNDVYAIFDIFDSPDNDNHVLHYDGTTWAPIVLDESLRDMRTMRDIWGTSASNIYVVGDGIVHYDGKTWKRIKTPDDAAYPNFFHDAHLPFFTGASFVKALWCLAKAFSWTSAGRRLWLWGPIPPRPPDFDAWRVEYLAISGSSASDVYVAGYARYPLRSPLLHYGRDHEWRPMDLGEQGGHNIVFCLPSGDVFVAGGQGSGVIHYDGKPCNEPPTAQGWRRLLFWRH